MSLEFIKRTDIFRCGDKTMRNKLSLFQTLNRTLILCNKFVLLSVFSLTSEETSRTFRAKNIFLENPEISFYTEAQPWGTINNGKGLISISVYVFCRISLVFMYTCKTAEVSPDNKNFIYNSK